jgi:predicted secreted protein
MYKWSVCDPLIKDVIEKGNIDKEDIISTFTNYPWVEMLEKLAGAKQEDICFSPSLEFRDEESGRGITFSAVEKDNGYCFYVFFKRPETVSKLFGLRKVEDPSYVSDILDQTTESSLELLNKFVSGKYDELRLQFS